MILQMRDVLICLIAAAWTVTWPSTSAFPVELEAKYFVVGNRFDAWYKPIVKLPAGWLENEDWSEQYERLVLFENGDMSRSKPMIYLRAHITEDQPLDAYIKGAQESWLKKVKETTIEPLPDVERTGLSPIKLFLYKNPTHPDHAFELTAFIKDLDSKQPPNTVFLQGVLVGGSQEIIEKARPAFLELLQSIR